MNKLISINWLVLAMGLLLSAFGLMSCSDDDNKFVPDGAVELSVTDQGTDVDALSFNNYGGSKLLTLVTNAYWEISVSDGADWLVLSNRSGDPTILNDPDKEDEPRYIKLTAKPLGNDATRTCVVTFRAADKVKTITITQQQPDAADDAGWESAHVANRNMGVGVNLWNTLDATGDWFDPDDIVACETCWGQPLAKQEWFDAVAASGFKAVRVPVTWKLHIDENGKVKEPWMNRVEEVVNYALNAGLYCIVNVHHDTGDGGWVCADLANIESICEKFAGLWTQIADRFNKYDHKLLFEGYNEVLDQNNSWVEPVEGGYEAINILAQTFVDAVRATGGNNLHRNLIVNTYGGGGSATRLKNMVMPADKIPGHLMLQVHNYTPAGFSNLDGSLNEDIPVEELPLWTKSYEKLLGEELDLLIEFSNTYGVPVVIGECGAYERILEEERAKYSEFITTYSRARANISVFFWGQVIDRTTCEELYPLFIDGFLKGLNL